MSEFTQLLVAAREGDRQAAADLFALVYDELRQLAALHLAHESPGQTLQPTALVHEVYLRLLGALDGPSWREGVPWEGRGHFFAAAAVAMRRILVDAARRKKRGKRGGGRAREPLDPDRIAEPEVADDLLDLHDALTALAAAQPAIAQLVELRYFGGLKLREAAEVLGIAPRTADAHWAYARAWLLAEMTRGDGTRGG
jgi:RNA polymerase sigma factor (TIGR02999 family)